MHKNKLNLIPIILVCKEKKKGIILLQLCPKTQVQDELFRRKEKKTECRYFKGQELQGIYNAGNKSPQKHTPIKNL